MKKTLFALMLGLSAAAAPVAALAQSPAADSRQAGYVQPLTAENSLLLLVDLQDMFGMTISSIDQTNLVNNAAGIAKAAKVFNVPTILASANAKSFAGPVFQQVTQARGPAGIRPHRHQRLAGSARGGSDQTIRPQENHHRRAVDRQLRDAAGAIRPGRGL
ncbi:hypothetical protein NFX37_08690 [Serratia marcescens]|nr:hypothetical protein NFX37_08690 [Serratia marcescens]